MLRGMGFGNNTSIFLASGKIYDAGKTMVPLLEMFPLLQTKETIASAEELAPFKVCLFCNHHYCQYFTDCYCNHHWLQYFAYRPTF